MASETALGGGSEADQPSTQGDARWLKRAGKQACASGVCSDLQWEWKARWLAHQLADRDKLDEEGNHTCTFTED